MSSYTYIVVGSLIATRTLASVGTIQPALYSVDGIHVDFGDECDVSSSEWLLNADSTTPIEEFAIQLDLDEDFTFSPFISTVDFVVSGSRVNSEADMFFGFGDGSSYFTLGVDFDGKIANIGSPRVKGIQIYPPCEGSLASGDVSDVLAGSSQYNSDTMYAVRDALAGGDLNNWEAMGGSRHDNGNTWPVTIEVENNVIADEVTVKFSSATQELECVYTGVFESDEDLVFGVLPDTDDGDNDNFKISSITVAKTVVDVCEGHCDASSAYAVFSPMVNLNELESESWTVELSGKDMLIMALCAINMVTLTAVICSCSRFGGAGTRRKKYQVVSVAGDSEIEQFQK